MKRRQTDAGAPFISVIVPVHNRRSLLCRTLKSIHEFRGWTGCRSECLVVDDASTDGTAEAVAVSANLTFSPILEERFDMVVRKEVFFDRNVQAFVEFLRSERFGELLKNMEGYNSRDTGKIMYAKTNKVAKGVG